MTTILADTFTASLGKLTNDEQKQAKLTAFDLQVNPEQPGLQFHRVDKAISPDVWSVRVNKDIRIILQRSGGNLVLVHVAHHDDAYDWAQRRRIGPNPTTGALQIVEVRELVEALPPAHVAVVPAPDGKVEEGKAPPLFDRLSREQLLGIGVPEDWLDDVLTADESRFFDVHKHLPPEAGEALLSYAADGKLPAPPPPATDPLAHPDTQRRFRVLDGLDELKAALDAPFEKWAVFLHPSQRKTVERTQSGPMRVVGSAGTGKTVVALHRVMHILQMSADARVLLVTFSEPLSRSLRTKLKVLTGDRPALLDRVTVASFERAAKDLYALATGGPPHGVAAQAVRTQLRKAADEAGVTEASSQFLLSEWDNVVDAWQVETAEAYGEVPRLGRRSRLGARQRDRLWPVFVAVRQYLSDRGLFTEAGLFAAVSALYRDRADKPFTHIVVDEAQDLGVPELRFLSAIAPPSPDALFFAGDLGQRIFRQPYSWKRLGVDVRGRSTTLKVNYRTSHQIRRAADRLLPEIVRDVDGLEDDRRGTVSVFEGPEPELMIAASQIEERDRVAAAIRAAVDGGMPPGEIAIFVRSDAELGRGRAVARTAGLAVREIVEPAAGSGDVLVGTMHLAKGLEFRMVVLVACDADVLPHADRVKQVADEFELDEVLATERALLYVAATRARDRLVVSGVSPGSEFLHHLAL